MQHAPLARHSRRTAASPLWLLNVEMRGAVASPRLPGEICPAAAMISASAGGWAKMPNLCPWPCSVG